MIPIPVFPCPGRKGCCEVINIWEENSSAREKRRGADHESLVLHDIPLQGGDGGGPLVDADARLIGVNVRARPPILRFLLPGIQYPQSDAERPDGKWPAEIIDQDVATPRPQEPQEIFLLAPPEQKPLPRAKPE